MEMLLEERNDALIVLGEDNKVKVLEKNPYNLLKHKYYLGKKIRFIGSDGLSIEETDQEGVFHCTFSGITVTIQDFRARTASAIMEAQSKGNVDPLFFLWKVKYLEKFLDINILLEADSRVDLTREGKLLLPESVELEILEWMERPDGGRVAKIQFSKREIAKTRSPAIDRIFTHEIRERKLGQRKTTTTRIVINEHAVALIGRDEIEQCWMHVLPPEYRNRSIASCEMWLTGGTDDEDELID